MEVHSRQFADALGSPQGCTRGFVKAPRIPGHEIVLLSGVPAEPVVHAMYERGFVISSGSACQSRSARRSHVLEAVGLAPDVDAVRIVASRMTEDGQMGEAGHALAWAVARVRGG
jgi:cysteine desulfurase